MSATPDPHAQPDFYRDVPLKRLLAWVVDAGVTLLACVAILPFTASSQSSWAGGMARRWTQAAPPRIRWATR